MNRMQYQTGNNRCNSRLNQVSIWKPLRSLLLFLAEAEGAEALAALAEGFDFAGFFSTFGLSPLAAGGFALGATSLLSESIY